MHLPHVILLHPISLSFIFGLVFVFALYLPLITHTPPYFVSHFHPSQLNYFFYLFIYLFIFIFFIIIIYSFSFIYFFIFLLLFFIFYFIYFLFFIFLENQTFENY